MPKAKAKLKAEKKPAELPKPPPERTPEEQALVDQHRKRPKIERPAKFKKMAGEERTLEPDGDFDLMVAKLMRDLGVKDAMFAGQLISQAASFPALKGSDSATASNFVTAAIQEIGPRDGVEAMLAMQMVATHNAAMEHLRHLAIDQNHIAVSDSIANRATKLLRTFTSQVEALNRYRNAGKQVITVNHIGQQVNANEAIAVGCLPGEAGGIIKNGVLPHVSQGNQRLNYRPEDDMRSEGETQRETLPARADGQRPVLSSWRREPRRPARRGERELQARPIHEGSNG